VRAQEIGLLRAAVPEEDLDAVVAGRVGELLKAGPRAIAEAKALIREVAFRRIEDVQRYTVERIAEVRASPEGQEACARSWRSASPTGSLEPGGPAGRAARPRAPRPRAGRPRGGRGRAGGV